MANQQEQPAQGTGFFLPKTFRVVPQSQQLPEAGGAHQSGNKSKPCKVAARPHQERRYTRLPAAKGHMHGHASYYGTHRKEACDKYISCQERTSTDHAMSSKAVYVEALAEDSFHHLCEVAPGSSPHDRPQFTEFQGIARHRSESAICSWVAASQLLSPAATPKSSGRSSLDYGPARYRSSSLSTTPRAATVEHSSDRSSFARLVEKLHQQVSAAASSGSCGTSSSSNIVRSSSTSSSHSGREHQSTLHVPSSTWPHYQHPGVMCCPPSEGPAW
jgi:hypothetical protein